MTNKLHYEKICCCFESSDGGSSSLTHYSAYLTAESAAAVSECTNISTVLLDLQTCNKHGWEYSITDDKNETCGIYVHYFWGFGFFKDKKRNFLKSMGFRKDTVVFQGFRTLSFTVSLFRTGQRYWKLNPFPMNPLDIRKLIYILGLSSNLE
jgi:hypothetical protein